MVCGGVFKEQAGVWNRHKRCPEVDSGQRGLTTENLLARSLTPKQRVDNSAPSSGADLRSFPYHYYYLFTSFKPSFYFFIIFFMQSFHTGPPTKS